MTALHDIARGIVKVAYDRRMPLFWAVNGGVRGIQGALAGGLLGGIGGGLVAEDGKGWDNAKKWGLRGALAGGLGGAAAGIREGHVWGKGELRRVDQLKEDARREARRFFEEMTRRIDEAGGFENMMKSLPLR